MIFNPDHRDFVASFQKQLKTCEFSLDFFSTIAVVLFPHMNTFSILSFKTFCNLMSVSYNNFLLLLAKMHRKPWAMLRLSYFKE